MSEAYNAVEQSRFVKHFEQPKRKRGRPRKKKKRKRGKGKRKKVADEATRKTKESAILTATLEGALAMGKRTCSRRINWDTPENRERRERIAKSWRCKEDLFRAGEPFHRFCSRVGINEGTLRRFLKSQGKYVNKKRGRKTLLPESVMRHICEGNNFLHVMYLVFRFLIVFCSHCTVVALHDEKSEGLSRRMIIQMIQRASGFKLSLTQAGHTWDRTVHPYGKALGLLTGYVKPQAGTSKRTAAGDPVLQKKWYDTVTEGLAEVERVAQEVLQDPILVRKMMPFLVANLDEESISAMGKNYKVVL